MTHQPKRQTTKYQTVDTSTLKGLVKAERLKANGWTIAFVGLFNIYFFKKPGVNQ